MLAVKAGDEANDERRLICNRGGIIRCSGADLVCGRGFAGKFQQRNSLWREMIRAQLDLPQRRAQMAWPHAAGSGERV
jgi:hypothetical protein